MHSPHDPLLTLDQAGDLLGTGPDLPRRLVTDGQLDHVRDGDDVRIPQSVLIAYVISTERDDRDSATDTEHHAA
jgi:excisionase family DNA binding protein